MVIVSIPFQRESPFGQNENLSSRLSNFEFQFPSNGKVLSDVNNVTARHEAAEKFQFPSNGKVLSDTRLHSIRANECAQVSIPFQRESPFGLKRLTQIP